MLTTNISYAKIFLFGIQTQDWTYTNPTGSEITIPIGTVMGIIPATDKCLTCKSAATDGSQVPYGVLLATTTVAGSATVTLSMAVQGQVDKDLLVFANGTDTLATTMSVGGDVLGTMRSVLTKGGIIPVLSTERSFYD